MQKFLKDTIESRYIKSLLYSIDLPIYRTVREQDFLVQGFTYIYNNNIIVCTSTGYINGSASMQAKFHSISEYTFGNKYLKFTDNFISKNNYYDTDTHIRLGRYLRTYRDVCGIDLMPFYNCYCNKFSSNFYITKDKKIIKQSTKVKYKVIEIPIRYNLEYTIAIDTTSSVSILPALMSKDDLIVVQDENISKRLWDRNYTSYTSLSFKNPITYQVSNNNSFLLRYEKNLYMLIQLPYNCDSSIVVLEGNYIDHTRWIFDIDGAQELSKIDENKMFLSDLSLLNLNDRETYAFSDRLIEYLFNNVVTENNEITNNIKRIKDKICPKYKDSLYQDVWDCNLRYKLYNWYTNKQSMKPKDINGYLDKDMEKFINSIKE